MLGFSKLFPVLYGFSSCSSTREEAFTSNHATNFSRSLIGRGERRRHQADYLRHYRHFDRSCWPLACIHESQLFVTRSSAVLSDLQTDCVFSFSTSTSPFNSASVQHLIPTVSRYTCQLQQCACIVHCVDQADFSTPSTTCPRIARRTLRRFGHAAI